MTMKKGAQFSLEECSCMEIMSHMTSNLKDNQEVGGACAEMVAQLCDVQRDSGEYVENMSQMMVSCCGIEYKDGSITKEA